VEGRLQAEAVARSAVGFAVGIGAYWLALRFVTDIGIVAPELQALLWFTVTIIGVAITSGVFLSWRPIDQVISGVVLCGLGWLVTQTARPESRKVGPARWSSTRAERGITSLSAPHRTTMCAVLPTHGTYAQGGLCMKRFRLFQSAVAGLLLAVAPLASAANAQTTAAATCPGGGPRELTKDENSRVNDYEILLAKANSAHTTPPDLSPDIAALIACSD
jgi:hypothetical protein